MPVLLLVVTKTAETVQEGPPFWFRFDHTQLTGGEQV